MIRRDYIIRMIEEFVQMLARLDSLKRGQLWQEAEGLLDEQFKRLIGGGAQAVAEMSDTELLAALIRGEPTQVVHYKMRVLSTLLHEAGDVAAAQGQIAEARACYLKGLHLVLETLAASDLEESADVADFVPKVETFVVALGNSPLPLGTQARLMQHYERVGAFSKAEDVLFAMLDAEPNEPKLLDFGVTFYQRLQRQSDASLNAGNLSREELRAGLAELEQRRLALART